MTDREKARDLGNQSAALARSIADVLNDTLDALEAAEARVAQLQAAQIRGDLPVALDVATTHIEIIVRQGSAYTDQERSRVADIALTAIDEVRGELMGHYEARAALAAEVPDE